MGDWPMLPELPIQFADFAMWQRRWVAEQVNSKQIDYWIRTLAGAPPILELPTDYPYPPARSFKGGQLRVELPVDLCRAIRVLGAQERVTLFVMMLSCFLAELHRYSGQDDICIGTGIANRQWRGTENLLGMIINNVVLRSSFDADQTFREFLARTRDSIVKAQENQDIPFERVVEALSPERSLSHNPLYQVMFSFQNYPLDSQRIPGLSLKLVEGLPNGSSKFDLSVIVIPGSERRAVLDDDADIDSITMLWEYNTDLFAEVTVARSVQDYKDVLRSVVSVPNQTLSG